MTIIPAIDIIDGRCVRLTKGDYNSVKSYSSDPVDMARRFEDAGLSRLHLVDLDGARSKHIVNHKVLERVAAATSLEIDFGGGIKSETDIRTAIECGACMVTIGSTAVTDPALMEEWIERFSPERVILGADVKDGYVYVNGWYEQSALKLDEFLENYLAKGITKVLCTDINRDGMLQGPAVQLYSSLLKSYPAMQLIASGGVSSMEDLERLAAAGLPCAIVGKAYYEGRVTLEELSSLNSKC